MDPAPPLADDCLPLIACLCTGQPAILQSACPQLLTLIAHDCGRQTGIRLCSVRMHVDQLLPAAPLCWLAAMVLVSLVHALSVAGWQGGVWRRKGWAAMDSLRERLEVLKELRDLVRSLGRGGGWGPLRRAPVQVTPALPSLFSLRSTSACTQHFDRSEMMARAQRLMWRI